MRRTQAEYVSRLLSSFSIVRVALLPIWWQPTQPLVLMPSSHIDWFLIAGGMPLPLGPVPGKALLSGTPSIANQ